MKKYPQVMKHIRDNYSSYVLRGRDIICRISAECGDVAYSTVYRAIRELIAMGAVDSKTRQYTGVQYIEPENLIEAMTPDTYAGNEYLLTEAKYQNLTKRFFCNRETVYFAIQWAKNAGCLDMCYGMNSYGLRLKLHLERL